MLRGKHKKRGYKKRAPVRVFLCRKCQTGVSPPGLRPHARRCTMRDDTRVCPEHELPWPCRAPCKEREKFDDMFVAIPHELVLYFRRPRRALNPRPGSTNTRQGFAPFGDWIFQREALETAALAWLATLPRYRPS